jgi:hypothetical protein
MPKRRRTVIHVFGRTAEDKPISDEPADRFTWWAWREQSAKPEQTLPLGRVRDSAAEV